MEKTNIIYVKLSSEQILEVKKVNKFKKKDEPSHAIIWEGHGQMFGSEEILSKVWYNWTYKLTQKEMDKSVDLRSIFADCIKADEYEFESYTQKEFKKEIAEINKELTRELNAKRMDMVDDEYQQALERVRAGTDYETLNGGDSLIKKIGYVLVVVIVLASLSTLFNF